jgi:hypothetical protein
MTTGLLLSISFNTAATTFYVDVNNLAPAAPYTNWVTAATNIQDAVDAALSGDEVVVTNGLYMTGGRWVSDHSYPTTNRVLVLKPVTVQSVNGPGVTLILGKAPPGQHVGTGPVRCAYLTNGAVLSGFTLTNGAASDYGGGVYCTDPGAVVTNCVVTGNSASWSGGAVEGGTVNNCTLTGNWATNNGGAADGAQVSCTLNNCTLNGNRAPCGGGVQACVLNNCTLAGNSAYYGGAAYAAGAAALSVTLNNCTLTGNWATNSGGGVSVVYPYLPNWAILNDCTLTGNSASNYGGGAYAATLNNCALNGNSALNGGGAYQSTLNSCTLSANSATIGGGVCQSTANNCLLTANSARASGAADLGTLNNSTLVANSATNACGGESGSVLTNCVVYYNTAPSTPNFAYGYMTYCCTTPAPISSGPGNITNAPLFVDQANNNLRLQSNSPCINAGLNASAPGPTDLGGNPRIVGGTVDIGAYECQSPALLDYFVWLQGYGLPTAASAIYADSDGDGMNNWQEWIAGTNPTNAGSVLLLAPPEVGVDGVTLAWSSVSNRSYYVERATNLAALPAFLPLQSNIPGLPGTTTFTDTNPPPSGPAFYRVGVQQ